MKYRVKGYYLRRIDFDGIVEADDEDDAEDMATFRDFITVIEEEGDDYESNVEVTERQDESEVDE